MDEIYVQKSNISGAVDVPASKSHTIRELFLASLAGGVSVLEHPLDSLDTRAAADACRAFGAKIDAKKDCWQVTGFDGEPSPPADVIDAANSGTTINIAMSLAALAAGHTVLTGDSQIRRRTSRQLLETLAELGAEAFSTRSNGCPPVVIGGTIAGGKCKLEAASSQFLTSLLIALPFAEKDSIIEVTKLNERPYVEMTLDWLRRLGVKIEHDSAMTRFSIPGCQRIKAFRRRIPADFSTAAYLILAAAVTGGSVTLRGLDMSDTQGDKAAVEMFRAMGADIRESEEGIVVTGSTLKAVELDLNATPDLLPALAVAACLAEGETRLVNAAHARAKETDRIAVMARELRRLGALMTETPDGLAIKGGTLKGRDVDGHGDHRVVMALAIAGMAASGTTSISTAGSASVTFPGFVPVMQSLGANIEV